MWEMNRQTSVGENTVRGRESEMHLRWQTKTGEKRNTSRPCLFRVTRFGIQSALFATVFINRKINMAAALTPELEEPISGFTYKTGC